MLPHDYAQELRALIVDDDQVILDIVSFALHQEGFACDLAADGEEALARLDENAYDLLVTDIRMPKKHGHALLVEVLDRPLRPKIIVHTCVDDPRLAKDMIVRGVDAVVYKPANYKAFAAKARGLVIRGRPAIAQPAMIRKDSAVDHHETRHKADQLHAPEAGQNISDMIDSHSFDSAQVAAAVQRDARLTALVLQLANSPSYNAIGNQITDVKLAITRIGQVRVAEIARTMYEPVPVGESIASNTQ